MIKVNSTIKMNLPKIRELTDAQVQALEMTAEALHTEVVQAQVFPRDTGNLQNESTFVDHSQSSQGKVSIVSTTPYLVFGPDGAEVCYLSSSSKRYKDHVSEMTIEEAEKVLDIPVVWFKYKEGYLRDGDPMTGKPIPGFYAEDVLEKFPAGAQLKDGLAEDWNYRTLIPPMLMLIQKLYREVEKNG